MRRYIFLLVCVLLSSCAVSGYEQFYTSYVEVSSLPSPEIISEDQEPNVYGTDDFDRDVRLLRAKKYVAIGYSSFNGGYEDLKHAKAQAKKVGATIVLVNSEYTNTQTNTSTLFLPDNRTTLHYGTAAAQSTYRDAYGNYGDIDTNVTYSGSSTSYGTKAVPITTHQRRYDQVAIYLVKTNPKMKFGVVIADLTPDLRAKYERNTGTLVDLVFEDSAAFFANILPGDVIISVDGEPVKNTKHAHSLMARVPQGSSSSNLGIIRDGKEIDILVTFDS